MTEDRLTPLQIQAFARHLRLEEKSEATMEKYLRDIRAFARWLDGREISKGLSAAWKAHLVERGYAPASINAMLSALNSLLEFLGLGGCRVKFLRVQRRLFRDAGRELTRSEYQRLLDAAHRLGRERLGSAGGDHRRHRHPGQRGAVSHRGGRPAGQGRDLPQGQDPHHPAAGQALPQAAQIRPKTKNRLRRDLSHQKRKRLSRRQIWAEMKRLCEHAGVDAGQGVSPQSAAPVRHGVLPGLPGHRQAGGRAGPQQHRDDPHLPGDLWRRAPADAGPAGTDLLMTEFAFRHE